MFRCLRHNVELGIDTTRFTAVLWKLSQRRCKMKASTRVLKVMRDMWYFGTARHDCPRGEGCQRTSLHHTNEQHSPLLGQRWTNFRALSVSSDRRRLSCAFLVQSFVLTSASWPSPRFACTPCNSASNTFELLVTSASLIISFNKDHRRHGFIQAQKAVDRLGYRRYVEQGIVHRRVADTGNLAKFEFTQQHSHLGG